MAMAGSEGVGGVESERQAMQRAMDALEASMLDESRSDQLFEQLMAKLAAEEVRRRRVARIWRLIGTGLGAAMLGAGAVRLLVLPLIR
jgi:hypothetical protein